MQAKEFVDYLVRTWKAVNVLTVFFFFKEREHNCCNALRLKVHQSVEFII